VVLDSIYRNHLLNGQTHWADGGTATTGDTPVSVRYEPDTRDAQVPAQGATKHHKRRNPAYRVTRRAPSYRNSQTEEDNRYEKVRNQRVHVRYGHARYRCVPRFYGMNTPGTEEQSQQSGEPGKPYSVLTPLQSSLPHNPRSGAGGEVTYRSTGTEPTAE